MAYFSLHYHSQNTQVKQKPLSIVNFTITGYRSEKISHCHGHLLNHCVWEHGKLNECAMEDENKHYTLAFVIRENKKDTIDRWYVF